MASSTNIDIIISAVDKASKVMSGVTKTADDQKKKMEQLGNIWGSAAKLATTAAMTFGSAAIVLKKAFDLGKQGATILQTRESFEMLMNTVGAAPDQLERLRAAAGGTIDEMTLMSSTSLLLAGIQGELATKLVDSSDEILNIAKAANKLNPSLGTTAFMYESLMTGLKRGQKLIIDNTGLTLDINAANEEYAKSLGKSTDALTEDERKMALINATMKAGKVLIDQVGGSTDSATDAFGKFDSAIKNATDAMKVAFTPAATDVAEAMTGVAYAFQDFWEESSKTEHGLKQLNELMKAGAITSNDYAALWLRMRLGVFDLDEALDDLGREQEEYNATLPKTITGYTGYVTALDAATKATGLTMAESEKLGAYLRDQHIQILDDTADANTRVTASIIEITNAAFGNMILGELDRLYANHNITLGEYRTLAGGVMEDMLGMKGAGIEAAFGVLELKEGLDNGVISAQNFVGSAQALLALLERIAASDWSTSGSMIGTHVPGQDTTYHDYQVTEEVDAGGQHGLDMIVPNNPRYQNDNFTVGASPGEHVKITPAGQQTTNNANVNVYLTINGGDGMSIYRQFRQALDADLRARRNAGIQYAGL